MNFEVEKRGLFDKKGYTKLLSFMCRNAKFITQKKRFQLVYLKRKDFVPDPKNPVDLRVRITNSKGKIVLKHGNWHTGETREEYEVDLALDHVDEILNIFKILGEKWGTAVYTDTMLFKYKGIEVAVVHTYHNIYYWEFEIRVRDKSDIKEAETKINNLIQEFSLIPFTSKGMQDYVNMLNKRKFWQFNFEKQDINEWLREHKKYIDLASRNK